MTVQAPPKTGLEKWKDGLREAVGDPKWSAWDCEVQRVVNDYNQHLTGTAGYAALDWQVIKAMLWVETGADNAEWKVKPMQIGVAGDPGLKAFLSGNEGGDLILPPAWKGRLTTASARSIPAHNIQAGVGYLLMRMANFDHQSVLAADSKVFEVTVKGGDSLDRIAKAQGSTLEVMKKLNPSASVLKPGQVLKVQKASVQQVITGWRLVTTASIALRYNSMRTDTNYAKKLDFALGLVRQGKVGQCAQ